MNLRNLAMPSFDLQVEVHARVDAGVAEVAVERAVVAEVVHHLAQVAKIGAEFFGRDRGVFPAFPVQRFAGNMRSDAEAGFANIPDALGLLAGVQRACSAESALRSSAVDQASGACDSASDRVAPPNSTISHPPPSGSRASPSELTPLRAVVVDQKVVKAFEANGFVLHNLRDVIGALINVGTADDQQHARRRTLDQAAGGFKNGDAGAFGTDECAGDVKAIFREQIVEVVSGDAARNIGELLANLIAVFVGDVLWRAPVDISARRPLAAPTWAHEIVLHDAPSSIRDMNCRLSCARHRR